MSQTYLIGLMDGLFPFGKRSKAQENQNQSPNLSGVSIGGSGITTDLVPSLNKTGVSRYLSTLPMESGVARYVKKQDNSPATGVTKYLVKQAISTKETPDVTRVAKYLANIEKTNPTASSVAKYMAQQLVIARQSPMASGVAKYLKKLEIAEKHIASLTGVAKYQAEQARIARKAAAQKLVNKYIEEETLAMEKAAEQAKETAMEEKIEPVKEPEATAITGVGRYLQVQEHIDSTKLPASGVAKYLAQQIVQASRKPALSGVEKYLKRQRAYTAAKPKASSVARYLEMKTKDEPKISGVSKYMINKALASKSSPVVSGVARYVIKQASITGELKLLPASVSMPQLLNEETGVSKYLKELLPINDIEVQLNPIVEKSIEGEFIPASEIVEEMDTVKMAEPKSRKSSAKKARATGVSKYLDEQAAVEKVQKASKRTGVERYLSGTAS